jgi:nitrogen fixation NifU-like protein
MDDLYREHILDHYEHPHHFGELDTFTFEAEGVNPLCGDEIKVQALVGADGRIEQLGFSGSGCAISQASMSMLSDEVVGRTLDEVAAMHKEQVLDLVGIPLSPMRLKCALLGLIVLKLGLHKHAGTEMPAGWDGIDEIAWQRD